MDAIKNFAKAVVSDGNYDASATEIDVIAGHGDRLPAAPFNAVWWNATDYPDPSDDLGVEIIRVTAKSTDTLTITRAQEGTAAEDHNVAGKTYNLIAGMTARTITETVGDVFGFGPALVIDPNEPSVLVRLDTSKFIDLKDGYTEIQQTAVYIGDFEGQGNSSYMVLDDANNRLTLNNVNLATTQVESATVAVGTLAGKLAIRDASGTIIGYLPIYSTIT
jgi:hypothetical protein